jgi:hypothetical protein
VGIVVKGGVNGFLQNAAASRSSDDVMASAYRTTAGISPSGDIGWVRLKEG